MLKRASRIKKYIFPKTIRGKLNALVVASMVVSMALALYAVLLLPRLAVEATRPLVYSGGAALTSSFQEALMAREVVILHSQVKPGLQQELPQADVGSPAALAFLHQANAEVIATSGVSAVAIMSPQGKVLDTVGQNFSSKDLVLAHQALAEGHVLYGTPYLQGNTALATMAVPIYQSGRSHLIGVEEAVLNLTSLARAVDAQTSADSSNWQALALITPGGILLYDHYGSGLGHPIVNPKALQDLVSGHDAKTIYVGEFNAPNAHRMQIGIFNRLSGVGYDLYLLTGEGIPPVSYTLPVLLALIALLFGSIALHLGGIRLIQPIREAAQAARSFGKGDLSARIPPQPDAEFQDLALAFNAAVAARAQSFQVETILSEAQEELAQAQSEEAALRIVADYACRIMKGKLAVVFTPGADDWLFPRAVSGEATDYAKTLRVSTRADLPDGQGPGGIAFREGRYLAMRTEPPFPPGLDFGPWQQRALAEGLRYLVVMPLLHHGTVLGLLAIYINDTEDPPAAAQEAVQALALTAAAALHGLSLREETMLSLAAALEIRDDETEVHAMRVAVYAERLAEELGISDPEVIERIRWGALLHDVGKIGLPDAVLRKPGPLTQEEWHKVRQHSEMGYDLIRKLEFLGDARDVVLYHHERFDGTGYPRGIAGDSIPLGARIFAVADTLDAITSDRPYRRARSYAEAKAEIRRVSGAQLDPTMVEAFERIKPEEWERLRRYAEAGFFSRFRASRAG